MLHSVPITGSLGQKMSPARHLAFLFKNISLYLPNLCLDSKVHGANMGPFWGRQDPDGPQVGPMNFVIQIKICAEYRDMLPRPRLVCQEPGLRPIGRSPGVPDKSSRGLGSMSRYSAQILICFIAYIFLFFFLSSVGLVGNFAGLPVCTVPSAIVHCNQNEAGHETIKAPSMPCWDAAGPSKHSLVFKSQPGENDR